MKKALALRARTGWKTLVTMFLLRRSAETGDAYAADLKDLARFMGAVDGRGRPDVPEAVARFLKSEDHAMAAGLAYRKAMEDAGLAAATINRRLACLRVLVRFASHRRLINFDGLAVAPIKGAQADRRGPTFDEVKRIAAAIMAQPDKLRRARDWAAFRMLHDLGIRRASLLGLDLGDVDLEGRAVWLTLKGKSGKERRSLPPQTAAALAAWIKERGREPGPVFLNLVRNAPRGRLSGVGLWLLCRRWGQAAGVEKLRPHGFRHAAITRGLDLNGGDIRSVAKFSGHADLAMVQRYDDDRTDVAGRISCQIADTLTAALPA